MAITATERFEIEKLLVLMFNAAPGADYLSDVVAAFEGAAHNLQTIANSLDDIPAFQSLHPNFQTAAEFAADFLTPLGLQADALALSFITDKFNAGVPKGEIMFEALQALDGVGAGSGAQYVAAKAILVNKATVAEYYSVTKGISNTDIGVLQTVLNGVTADTATVTTAESQIDGGTRGVQGTTASLTTTQDTVTGTNAADLVNGLFGGADATYTAGDSIDLGAGTDRLNLVATGTTASAAVTVKNVEAINIQDTVGATFNALLVENNAGISFTNTVTGQTSTVTNGALGSTMGLAGKGDLYVDYATTSGTTDTANVSLSSVGTSSKIMSTVNVNDGNTVEAVKIAATGTNFVNLLAGTAAATVTITGDGTNTFTMGSIKAVSTIDASASTGTNTFNLGGTFGNGDVVKGGTGADTVNFTGTTALGIVTLTGVETVKAEIDADVALNLGTSTGLKTLTLAGGSGDLAVSNATNELTTVNYQSIAGTYSGASGDFDNDFSLAYKTGQVGNIVLNLGSATATQILPLNSVSFTRAESVTINALGTKAISVNAGGVNIDDTTKSVAVNAGDSGHLALSGIDTGGAGHSAMGSLTVTAGADAYASAGYGNFDGAADLAVTITAGASGDAYLYYTSAGSYGDVTVTAGAHGTAEAYELTATDGGFGNVTVTAGSGGSGYAYAYASGGADTTIGNVSLTLASGASGTVYAYSYSGDVGNTTEVVGAHTSGYIGVEAYGTADASGAYAAGGNIGDLSLTVNGASGSGDISAYASGVYSGGDGAGGNIGNVTLSVTGSGATGYISAYSSGGSQGDFTITVGASGTAYVSSFAGEINSGADHGNVGNINVGLADSAYFSGYWDASGSVGNTVVEAGNNVSAFVSADGYSGDVGTVTVSMGDNAWFSGWFSASAGSVGAANVTVGEGSYVDIGLESEGGGTLGAINVTAGVGSTVWAYSDGSTGVGTHTTADAMTVAGGEAGDQAYGYASGGSIAGIDFHGWLGHYLIDASHVSGGTVITGGADGGTIIGALGASVITGGAGADFILSYDAGNVIDGGAGNDTILGGAGADNLTGGTGDDSINGGGGADAIVGGAGNDTIDGGTGPDEMTGGAGNDTYYVDNVGDQVHEDAGGGTDTVYTSIAGFTAANVENIIYSLAGTAGNDSMTGGTSGDTLNGLAGNDTINGGAGNDTIDGGAGNDVIDGGAGVDFMTGGTEADTFVFTGTGDVLATPVAIASGAVNDVITDFVTATDKLDFATAGSATNYAEQVTAAAGSLSALLAAADTALDGTVQYYFGVVGSDGYLVHSTDGTTTDAVIKLTGTVDIAYTDIV